MALVRSYGRRHYSRGAFLYFFGRREARRHRSALGRVTEYLEGIMVIVGSDRRVVTAYRDAQTLRQWRKGRR